MGRLLDHLGNPEDVAEAIALLGDVKVVALEERPGEADKGEARVLLADDLHGAVHLKAQVVGRASGKEEGGEGKVRYVKKNALQGRDEELSRWEDYLRLATYWRDEVANVRIHAETKARPVDRFAKDATHLLPRGPAWSDLAPAIPADLREIAVPQPDLALYDAVGGMA